MQLTRRRDRDGPRPGSRRRECELRAMAQPSVCVALYAPPSLPSFRCPIWNVPQVTLDSRPWARPCPASTWRTNPSSSPNFAVCCSLFLFYFIFISISSWGFQSVAILCPAAFQHHDGVVDSSSFRGGLSLPSASGRGGLRFGVLTLEGVPGVVGISSKQPEHSLHV